MLEERNKTQAEVQEERHAEIWDAERKVRALLNEMQAQYDTMQGEEAPGDSLNRYRDLVKAGRHSYEEPVIQNTEHWICSYKRIMIKLDIMEDYLTIIEKAIEAADAPIDNVEWTPQLHIVQKATD